MKAFGAGILMKNLSIIIPVKIESTFRQINFEFIVKYLTAIAPECELVVVGHIDNPYNQDSFTGNIQYIELEAEFTKSFYCNYGAARAQNEILCFYDSDCLVTAEGLKEIIERITAGEISMGFPFKRFICSGLIETEELLEKGVEAVAEFAPNPNTLGALVNEFGFQEWPHPGAAQMVHRDVFKRVLGYNEFLTTWGGEDVEFLEKIQFVYGAGQVQYTNLDVDCIHLYHTRPPSKWNKTFLDLDRQRYVYHFYQSLRVENRDACIAYQAKSDWLNDSIRDTIDSIRDAEEEFVFLKQDIDVINESFPEYQVSFFTREESYNEFLKRKNGNTFERHSAYFSESITGQLELETFENRMVNHLRNSLRVQQKAVEDGKLGLNTIVAQG